MDEEIHIPSGVVEGHEGIYSCPTLFDLRNLVGVAIWRGTGLGVA
jgi:hypothetical protein